MHATCLGKEPIMTAAGATSTKPTGWAKVPADVLCDRDLSDRAKTLYGLMRLHAWESTGSVCKAKHETLAAELRWSLSKAKDALLELRNRGWVTKTRTGRANAYVVLSERDTAAIPAIRQPRSHLSDSRDPGYRNLYIDVPEVHVLKQLAAAALEGTSTTASIEWDAEALADYINSVTGKRPKFTAADSARIFEYGYGAVKARVDYAIATGETDDTHWFERITDRLSRVVSAKSWASMGSQMVEAEIKRAKKDADVDTSVSDPDYAVEADYSGGAAYAAEWEREHMAVAA
jgi:hypothetical protein